MSFMVLPKIKIPFFYFLSSLNLGRVDSNNRTGCGVKRCRKVRNDWCNSFSK